MIPFDAVRRGGGGGEQGEESRPSSQSLMHFVSSQIAGMRRRLRLGLPVLTREDLRRYRMYESESVLLELLNSGSDWAAQVLWQLLQLDKQARAELDVQAARLLRRQSLARSPELLHGLAVGLAEANAAIREGDPGSAGAQLLLLAETSWSRGLGWWWLTERLLQLAAEQSHGYLLDGGLCEASVALARGIFLLRQLNECGESLGHLARAAELSAGKPWHAAPSLLQLLGCPDSPGGEAEQGVFQVASRALAQALEQEARAARKGEDHDRATALCREAVQRAQDARAVALELSAQRELGVSLLAASRPQEAAAAFRVFLSLAQAAGSSRDVITAHLKLALCHHSQGDSDGALRCLRQGRVAAEELGQPDLLAKAHTFLGELFLNTSRPRYATGHLHAARALLGEMPGLRPECDRVRALTGVAGGLELLKPFVEAIRDSGPGSGQLERRTWLLKLLSWKDRRRAFWPDDYVVSNAVRGMHAAESYLEEAAEDTGGALREKASGRETQEDTTEGLEGSESQQYSAENTQGRTRSTSEEELIQVVDEGHSGLNSDQHDMVTQPRKAEDSAYPSLGLNY